MELWARHSFTFGGKYWVTSLLEVLGVPTLIYKMGINHKSWYPLNLTESPKKLWPT